MTSNKAKEAFEQLAEAYLVASKRSIDAEIFVRDLRYEHSRGLREWNFAQTRQEHTKKALNNDTKGLL